MNSTDFTTGASHLALLCLLAAPSAAQQILQPVAASTTLPGSSSIAGLIDQTGLLATYVDGETDFATFVASTPHRNSRALSLSRDFVAGRIVTLDLGGTREIDAIALWGQQTFANTLTAFTMFADTDDNFGNGTTSSMGSFSGGIDQPGSVFAFAPTATRFVHLRLDANGGGTRVVIAEAAFRRAAPTDTPGLPIIQPSAADTSLVQLFGAQFGIGNVIDQSGLSASYVGGTTEFATFVPSTSHPNSNQASLLGNSNGQNQPNGVVQPGETITFDLGVAQPTNGIAIWNPPTVGDAILGFELFADADNDFTNGTSRPLGAFAVSAVRTGQAFGFTTVTTRFVHLRVTAHGGGDFLRLGEAAFRSSVGVVNTIAHGGNFAGGVAYDAVTDEVIVVDDRDDIHFYDRATGAETLRFTAPGRVIGAQVDITTGNIWAVGEDEVVREIDRTGAVLTSFSVDPTVNDASALAIDPVTDTLWISNDGANTVTEFQKDGTPTGAAFVPTGSTDGDGLAYDPTTRTFLVGEDTGDAILVVDRTGNLLEDIDVSGLGLSPEGLAIDTTTGRVFCGNGTVVQTVSELTGILDTPPARALVRYGSPCGGRIAASDVLVDDGVTESGLWIGYQGTLPPGNAFLLVLGLTRQNIPLSTILPSPCTAFAQAELHTVFGFTSSSGRGGIRLALPPGFPGFQFTTWAADVDLVNFGIPSSSGGLEIVVQ
ncbi:MAG: PQQ-binding-like beta-propeller repeat protein [bacterium]|nr:PQQ-binding-like beta-propeller repeat protein [bacterium]